jgi:predicted  nucleic acid-binding Zn-ribbon protein
MKLQNILKYQEKDFEIFRLKNSSKNDEIRKLISKSIERAKNSQSKSLQLEKQSSELTLEFENLKKLYSQNLSSLTVLANTSYSDLSESDIEVYERSLNDLNNNITIIENKLSSLAKTINVVLSNFEKERKNHQIARNEYNKNKQIFDAQQEEVKPAIEAMSKELKELEKDINADVLEKYKKKRQDNRFPIIVQLSNNTCGGCQMELSYAFLNSLKEKKILECEHCRRYIFSE